MDLHDDKVDCGQGAVFAKLQQNSSRSDRRAVTALDAYLRLESTGLWRASPEAQRRDVYVFLGDASLVMTDKAEQPVAHWSLPAVTRLNSGATPALFIPGPDASETLEIDDPEMIAAIEKVQQAMDAAAPKPGRLRLWIALSVATSIAAGAVFWLPGALVTHAERVVPHTKRLEIGQQLQGHIMHLTGQACGPRNGAPELRVIARRLGGQQPAKLYIVPDLTRDSLSLPGGIVLLDRHLIEDHDSPSVLAGFALAELTESTTAPPLLNLLKNTSLRASLALLTTGNIDDDILRDYAGRVLRQMPVQPDPNALLSAFRAARVPSTPYATALDSSGEITLPLIQSDPFAAGTAPELLPDNSWVALQALCDNA